MFYIFLLIISSSRAQIWPHDFVSNFFWLLNRFERVGLYVTFFRLGNNIGHLGITVVYAMANNLERLHGLCYFRLHSCSSDVQGKCVQHTTVSSHIKQALPAQWTSLQNLWGQSLPWLSPSIYHPNPKAPYVFIFSKTIYVLGTKTILPLKLINQQTQRYQLYFLMFINSSALKFENWNLSL